MSTPAARPGLTERVVLVTPDNPRADGQPATVVAVAPWGCHLATTFGSGGFRALWSEVRAADRPAARPKAPGEAGYSGEACPHCQGQRMVRSGTCATCQDCGTTSGCS